MNDKIPALGGETSCDVLAKHLNSLNSARKAFLRCEADEKIRRALRHQIRAVEENFNPKERVFYKRDHTSKWLGPARVILQDGRIVFLRHGGNIVRVSTSRLVKDLAISSDTSSDTTCEKDTAPILDDNVDNTNDKTGVPNVKLHEKNSSKKSKNVCFKESISCSTSKDVLSLNNGVQSADSITNNFDDLQSSEDTMCHSDNAQSIENSECQQNVCDNIRSRPKRNIKGVSRLIEEINVVEVPEDEHANSECTAAKLDELMKIQAYNVYENVKDTGHTAITTTWVLTKKCGKVRARLVARGFQETINLVCDSPTVSKTNMRIVIALANIYNWCLKQQI